MGLKIQHLLGLDYAHQRAAHEAAHHNAKVVERNHDSRRLHIAHPLSLAVLDADRGQGNDDSREHLPQILHS